MKKIDYILIKKKVIFSILMILSGWYIGSAQSLACDAETIVRINTNDEAILKAEEILGSPIIPGQNYTVEVFNADSSVFYSGLNEAHILNASQLIGDTLIGSVATNNGSKCWGNVFVKPYVFECKDNFFTVSLDSNNQVRITTAMLLEGNYDPGKDYSIEINMNGVTAGTGVNEVILAPGSDYTQAWGATVTDLVTGSTCTAFFGIINPTQGAITCDSLFVVTPDTVCTASFSPIDYVNGFDPAHGVLGVLLDSDRNEISDYSDYFYRVDLSGRTYKELSAMTFDAANGDTCTTILIIHDTIPPVAYCKNLQGQTLWAGSSYPVEMFGSSSVDNCDLITLEGFVSDTSGTPLSTPKSTVQFPATAGDYTITVIVADNSGNEDTCTTLITTHLPTVNCNDVIQYSVDEQCQVFMEPDHWLEGIFPSGPYSMEISLNGTVIHSDIDSIRFWNASDYLGEVLNFQITETSTSESCSGTLTIEDKLAPVALCQDTLPLITVPPFDTLVFIHDIDGGSTDNCGLASMGVSLTDGNGNPIGSPASSVLISSGTSQVLLTVTDGAGNTASCLTVVTNGTSSGNLRCNNFIQYSTDANCEIIMNPDQWLEGLTPPGNYFMQVSFNGTVIHSGMDSISFSDAGDYLGDTLSFLIANPVESCSGVLRIEDKIAPLAVCEDSIFIIASTDPFVDYVMHPDEVDNGSWDNCGSVFLQIALSGNNGNPMSPPSDSVSLAAWAGLDYTILLTVTDDSGNESHCLSTVVILPNNIDNRVISGVVFGDMDGDCTLNGSETGSGGWNLATVSYPSNSFTNVQVNTDGSYSVTHNFPDTDTLLKIFLLTPMNLTGTCPNVFCHDLRTDPDPITFDFAIQVQAQMKANCPVLQVDISPATLESCEETEYVINYCNYGTGDADNAEIRLTFDDYLTILSSDLPWTDNVDNTYTFDIGTVEQADCGSFTVQARLSCDSEPGQAHLVEAVVSPDEECLPEDPAWSGASIEVEGECIGDSIVFTIRNVGDGDMLEPRSFIVIEDVILHKQASFDLLAHAELRFAAHGKGNTCRLEAEQVPGHPGKSFPSVTVEGCGEKLDGSVSRGFYVQFPQDDDDFFKSKNVRENVAVSPFDLIASPRGVESLRYLKPNRDIEYLVRFSNRNATATKDMEVKMNISEYLEIGSIIPGISSHEYRYEISESGEVRFIFEDIDLAPNESEAAFFKFNISQKPNLPNDTDIITSYEIHAGTGTVFVPGNSTWHRVSTDFLTSSIVTLADDIQLSVAPNPFFEKAIFEFRGITDSRFTLKLTDMNGRLVRTEVFEGSAFELDRKDLPQGVYFFTILSEKGMPIAVGKLSTI